MTTCVRGDALPLCPRSELPRLLCDCCDSFTMTATEVAYLDGLVEAPKHHVIPVPRRPFRLEPPHPAWQVNIPNVIICDHGHTDDTFLCPNCIDEFEQVLGDVSGLVDDLDLAITKQVSFVERGAPQEADPEESTLPFNQAASDALGALRRAFHGDPVIVSRDMLRGSQQLSQRPDLPILAGRITAAVKRAHQVIDRPPTPMHYGPCPRCGDDIKQERTQDPESIIKCPCGYAAALADHQRACLVAGVDRWLTLTELVSTLTQGGVPITRQRIENMIYRQGLPREQRVFPKWRNGTLVDQPVYVYRLGDVLEILETRRRSA